MPQRPLKRAVQHLRHLVDQGVADAMSDRQLLERFVRQRDESAFDKLVQRHGPMVLRVCGRILGSGHDVDDGFQATFLVLVRRAEALPWREALGGWLHGVALRVALKIKAQAVRHPLPERAKPAKTPHDPVQEEVLAGELRQIVDEELRRLPARYRDPLVLCDLEGRTHAEAARELGWPRGSLAKRLEVARDCLRERLVARGLTLATSLVGVMLTDSVRAAVPSGLVGATLKTIFVSMTAEGVVGTASVPAIALAEGLLHTMHHLKVKAVLSLLLTVSALGGGVGLLLHQAGAAKAPAPSRVAEGSQDVEVEELPLPSRRGGERVMDLKLNAGVVVMIGPGKRRGMSPPAYTALQAETYAAALAETSPRPVRFLAGDLPSIVSVGPPLEREDHAVVKKLIRQGNRLRLEVIHTRSRPAGTPLLEKGSYRPLMSVPVDLEAGKYQLTATWQAVTALTDSKLNDMPSATYEYAFVIVDNLVVSPSVSLEGLDFETLTAKAEVRIPASGQQKAVNVGLRVHNRTNKEVTLSTELEDVVPQLWAPDGKRLASSRWQRMLRVHSPVPVPPHRRITYWQHALLSWSADGKTMELRSDSDSWGWRYAGLMPGKYAVSFEYTNDRQIFDDRPCWMGKVQTRPVSLTLVAP